MVSKNKCFKWVQVDCLNMKIAIPTWTVVERELVRISIRGAGDSSLPVAPTGPCPWTSHEWMLCHTTMSKLLWIKGLLTAEEKTKQSKQTKQTALKLQVSLFVNLHVFKVILFYIIFPVSVPLSHPIRKYWVRLWWGVLPGATESAVNKTLENACPLKLLEEGGADGITYKHTLRF